MLIFVLTLLIKIWFYLFSASRLHAGSYALVRTAVYQYIFSFMYFQTEAAAIGSIFPGFPGQPGKSFLSDYANDILKPLTAWDEVNRQQDICIRFRRRRIGSRDIWILFRQGRIAIWNIWIHHRQGRICNRICFRMGRINNRDIWIRFRHERIGNEYNFKRENRQLGFSNTL